MNDDAFKPGEEPETDQQPSAAVPENAPAESAEAGPGGDIGTDASEASSTEQTSARFATAEWVNAPAPVDDPMAVGAMVMSIVGLAADVGMLVCCIFAVGPVLSLAGAILGGIALKRIRDFPDQYKGETYAWVAIALGGANILLFLVMLLFGFGFAIFSGMIAK